MRPANRLPSDGSNSIPSNNQAQGNVGFGAELMRQGVTLPQALESSNEPVEL